MSMESKARKEDMSIQAKVAKDPAMSVETKASKEDMSVKEAEVTSFAKAAKIAKAQSMPVE